MTSSNHYSEQEEALQEQEEDEPEDEEEENCGFRPLIDENIKKRKREEEEEEAESPEMKELREKINILLCRYPKLVPRSSHAMMNKLKGLELSELQNIYTNCINDLSSIRGTPSAESIILLSTYYIDVNLIKGYTRLCLRDAELRREIETEVITLIGHVSNKVSILFRFFNNLYACLFSSSLADRSLIDHENDLYYTREEAQSVQNEERERGSVQEEYIKPLSTNEEQPKTKKSKRDRGGG
jgi:hypothetical protein